VLTTGASAPPSGADEGDEDAEEEEALGADEAGHVEPRQSEPPREHAPSPAASPTERGAGFSLFSWLRREPGPEQKKD
jgi:hypothetical protein